MESKETVTIEKEVWESTLRVSMERAGKIETLQEQLDIAVKCMQRYIRGGCYPLMEKKLKEIEELNK